MRFYPAAEIARELILGGVDIGVTGTDLIHEASENGEENVLFVRGLGFGEADVVVAVPDSWIDVQQMSDLADVASDFRARHGRWLRVATKYVNLTRRHFAKYGIAEYRIVESAGATEAAPAAGSADLIVDITSTGSTLAANQLRVLEDGLIMKSEANLIVSRTADWTPLRKAQLEALLSIMGGVPPGISTLLIGPAKAPVEVAQPQSLAGDSHDRARTHHPDAVPQRGRDAGRLHRQGARFPRTRRHRRRGADRGQRLDRRQPGHCARGWCAGRRHCAEGLWRGADGRHRGGARKVRHHGRRRRQLRFRQPRAASSRACGPATSW